MSLSWKYTRLVDANKQNPSKPNYLTKHYQKYLLVTFLIILFFIFNFLNSFTAFYFKPHFFLTNHGLNFRLSSQPKQPLPLDLTKYLLYTPTCVLASIPPFTNETLLVYRKFNTSRSLCPRPDVSSTIKRVNFTWVRIPAHLTGCTAVEILREPETESAQYGRTFAFGSRTILNFPNSDAVIISCSNTNKTAIIPLIPIKTPAWTSNPTSNLPNAPNILVIGLDSISRLNFHRHFTRTKAFIKAAGFIGPLSGHHKVGDNTFPNLIPILTGTPSDAILASLPESNKLDDIPLIFKNFAKAGYLTTFIEDMSNYGLFTWAEGVSGFIRQPTDYWLRPVNVLITEELQNDYCYKEKLEMEVYYDYIYDQMRAFRQRKQRFITFTHMASLTHDYLNLAQLADKPVFQLLNRIFRSKLHQDTVILFFSDHGIRFGPILETVSGYSESRLPLLAVYVPESLRLKDSSGAWMDAKRIRNVLEMNCHRLTSQFDVHATLKHILRGNPRQNGDFIGQSLFTPVPLNRTCENAGIPDDYCLCLTFKPFTDPASISQLSNYLVQHLNDKLFLFNEVCETLTLDKVLQTAISSNRNGAKRSFILKIRTHPNNGTFETRLRALVSPESNEILDEGSIEITGSILRLDLYRNQSLCVAGLSVESICYCKQLLTNSLIKKF